MSINETAFKVMVERAGVKPELESAARRFVEEYEAANLPDQPDEIACLKAAEESLSHHGYNPATNRDVARICFNAMRGYLKRESGDDALEDAERDLGMLEDRERES